MKLGTYFKKCPVITCFNGTLQATDKGVGFIEYLPQASKLNFSCDAKMFIEAINTLSSDFIIKVNEDLIHIFDQKQEVKLLPQTAELPIELTGKETYNDFATPFVAINKFVDPAFPAVKVSAEYFETITSSTIIRYEHNLFIDKEKIVIAYKLPKKSESYALNEDNLIIFYNDQTAVVISVLDQRFPNTDKYFPSLPLTTIPEQLKQKLVSAKEVIFDNDTLILRTEKVSDTVIERIKGQGKYEFKVFKKAMEVCKYWCFTGSTLYCEGNGYKIIMENLDA